MNKLGIAVLSCLTMILTFMGLSNLIAAGGWQIHMIGFPLILTIGMWAVCALTSPRWPRAAVFASLAVGVVIWVCYLCAIVTGAVIPTPGRIQEVAQRLSEAVTALPDYGRPTGNSELFLPLGLVGLGPMCILGIFLAVVVGLPAMLGVPVLGCWTVFLSGVPGLGLGWAIASGAAYLALLAVAPRMGRTARLRVPAVLILVLASVLGLVTATMAPSLPRWGQSVDWLYFWDKNYSDRTGLSVDGPIRVGDTLRTQSTVQLFRTQGEFTEPLKMGTLDTFNGQQWSVTASGRTRQYRTGSVMWYGMPYGRGSGQAEPLSIQWSQGPEVTVMIDELSSSVVPAGNGPRSVTDLHGLALNYDSSSDSFRTRVGPASGDWYVTDTMVLNRDAVLYVLPDNTDSLLDSGQFPHLDDIRDLTLTIIGGAITQDGILTAIESYLRGSDFTYTLSPTWENHGDPVWDFLTNKEGYCVHYATAMAVMAMSVGIPMHVSVGYLPGVEIGDGWTSVTGARAHMWPEAYYPGLGWVRYEPTPAVGTGTASQMPMGDITEAPVDESTASAMPIVDEPTEPTAVPTTGAAGAQKARSTWDDAAPWVLGIAAGVVALAVLGVGGWMLFLRAYSPERAWRSIRRAGLKKGVLTEGMSVRTAIGVLSTTADASVAKELTDLRNVLEDTRYGPADADQPRIPGPRLWTLRRTLTRALRS